MSRFFALCLIFVFTAVAPAWSECTEQAIVGNFQVDYEGAVFDGAATTFTYCITGLEDPDFRALSNWMLTLDPKCLEFRDLIDCSTEFCEYQENDPNHGLSGIKFDEVEVQEGETECFDFTLDGDWTEFVRDTEIGLKAGQMIDSGRICGPSCEDCEAELNVTVAGGEPSVFFDAWHRRPPTVITPVYYKIEDEAGNRLYTWIDGPVVLEFDTRYTFDGPLPGLQTLEPGLYRLRIAMKGMASWIVQSQVFEIPAE